MTRFADRPYRFTFGNGRVSWFVNELWFDHDHWVKAAAHPFRTEGQALRFIEQKRREGLV